MLGEGKKVFYILDTLDMDEYIRSKWYVKTLNSP